MNDSKEKNIPMPTTNPTKPIAIVGAGAMGSGIAQVAAQAGCSVILLDRQQEALDRSNAALHYSMPGMHIMLDVLRSRCCVNHVYTHRAS